jgi:hypothetical protein
MLTVYPIFNSYSEAIEKLNFAQEIFIVKVTDGPESIETMRYDKNLVKIIGTGLKKSPGHPSGNQHISNQNHFFWSLATYNQIPVLHKNLDGNVEFLGYYRHLDTKIKISFAGFRYFEFTLQRVNVK